MTAEAVSPAEALPEAEAAARRKREAIDGEDAGDAASPELRVRGRSRLLKRPMPGCKTGEGGRRKLEAAGVKEAAGSGGRE